MQCTYRANLAEGSKPCFINVLINFSELKLALA